MNLTIVDDPSLPYVTINGYQVARWIPTTEETRPLVELIKQTRLNIISGKIKPEAGV